MEAAKDPGMAAAWRGSFRTVFPSGFVQTALPVLESCFTLARKGIMREGTLFVLFRLK